MKYKIINKRKGEVLPRTWVMGFIIFSGVFALMFLASSNLIIDYGREAVIDNDYSEHYDTFTNTSEDYRGLFTDMSDGSSGALDIIFGDAGIIRSVGKVIQITFSSIEIVDTTNKHLVNDFGIPEGIANAIFPVLSALIMIFLIMAVISSLQRGSKL